MENSETETVNTKSSRSKTRLSLLLLLLPVVACGTSTKTDYRGAPCTRVDYVEAGDRNADVGGSSSCARAGEVYGVLLLHFRKGDRVFGPVSRKGWDEMLENPNRRKVERVLNRRPDFLPVKGLERREGGYLNPEWVEEVVWKIEVQRCKQSRCGPAELARADSLAVQARQAFAVETP
jgi:hypothetical protein